MEPVQVLHCQNVLGEGPLWNIKEQAIYWVDIDEKKIQRYYPDTKKYEIFDMPKKIGLLAFRRQGGLICGAEDGFYFWEPGANQFDFICNPEEGKADGRFNDGKVDRAGRLWAGTMTPQGASSSLYRLDADLSVHRMVTGTTISNGIGWSPDNKTMYFVDSKRYIINAYDYDLATGTISNQRPFIQKDEHFGIPDGMTVDCEGYVWVAVYDGWKVMRYDPDGAVAAEIKFPVSRPSSVMFGGKDLDELYVTTISEGLSDEEKRLQPMAGDLFVLKTDVKGIPEPEFAG